MLTEMQVKNANRSMLCTQSAMAWRRSVNPSLKLLIG